MDQETRWMARYEEVVGFVETNHRNPSKHRIEEHDMLNWVKQQRKLKNKGELKTEERPYLYRIAFPHSAAVELYQFLEREGHTAAKIFPGYGGVAKSIIEADRFRGKAMTQKKGIENADGAEA